VTWGGTVVISRMILQSQMDVLKGELGSSSETCVSSTVDGNVIGLEAERISSMTEEEDQGPRTIPVIKTEPKVSGVPLVSVRMFHTGYIQYCLPLHQCVLMKPKFQSLEWILGSF